MHPSQDATAGIVVADTERLILRPTRVGFRRRTLLRLIVILGAATVGIAVVFAYFARPYVTYPRAVVAALLVALVYAYQFTTQVTYVALRSGAGIVVATKNRVLRINRQRLLHRYADIRGVRLRSRVNPNAARPGVSPTGAYLHYDILLEKESGSSLLWYTRYRSSAAQIATTIATFAGVELMDPENIARVASDAPHSNGSGGA